MNMRTFFCVIVWLLCFFCSVKVFAASVGPAYPTFGEIPLDYYAVQQSDHRDPQTLAFFVKFINDNPELKTKYIEYLNARFQREIDKAKEQKVSIAFSELSTYVIFIFIHIVFVVGIWLLLKKSFTLVKQGKVSLSNRS